MNQKGNSFQNTHAYSLHTMNCNLRQELQGNITKNKIYISGLTLISPYLPTSMFTCECFRDTSRRHETPESETKDFSIHSTAV